MLRRGGRGGSAAEDSATAVKIAKDKDPWLCIHRLSKNKTKLSTLVLNLVTLER